MDTDYTAWYELHYPELSGYGLWLRGGELNTCALQDFYANTYRILITRLSTYRDTAESFTHKLLYQIATSVQGVFADLAFLPPPRDVAVFDRDAVPWLLGTSTKHAACDFHMIAFSNSVVQELINLPHMLRKSGIPIGKKQRMELGGIPLLILGGANALNTASLLSDDPMVDGIFVGEDQECIRKLFAITSSLRRASKRDILEELQSVEGFFQPDVRKRTRKKNSQQLAHNDLMAAAPVMYDEDQLGKGNLQISEGCPCFCSFCAEGWSRKPYRELPLSVLEDGARIMKATMGLDSIELYSFNFNMHREFYPLLWRMRHLFNSIGLKSQRFDFLADDPELAGILHAANKSSITCGLEGISSRLRAYLHKSLDEKKLHTALNALLRAPIRELKLFLIATGLENEQDYDEFRELLSFINTTLVSSGRRPRIILSMTPLVRFPYTPLQNDPAPDIHSYLQTIGQIERITKSNRFEFRTSADLSMYIVSQILSRAHTPLIMEILWETAEETGFVFYEEYPTTFLDLFKEKLELQGLQWEELLSGRYWNDEHKVPVELNVDSLFLSRLYERSRKFQDEGYCLGAIGREGECKGCGACETIDTRSGIEAQRRRSPFSSEELKKVIREQRNATRSLIFKVSIDECRRGIPRKAFGVALARALMLCEPQLIDGYRGYGGSYLDSILQSAWVSGDDLITLKWYEQGLESFQRMLRDDAFIKRVNQQLACWGELQGISSQPVEQLTLSIVSSGPCTVTGYFQKNALKGTAIKIGDGVYRYDLTPQSLKKKLLLSLQIARREKEYVITIIPGQKFRYDEFSRMVFDVPAEYDRVRLRCSATLGYG